MIEWFNLPTKYYLVPSYLKFVCKSLHQRAAAAIAYLMHCFVCFGGFNEKAMIWIEKLYRNVCCDLFHLAL